MGADLVGDGGRRTDAGRIGMARMDAARVGAVRMDAVALNPGRARGTVLVLDEPLSLWGGMDPATGRVTDRRHPQHGATLAGRVLAMPGGRGSSSSSSVLAEAVRAGTAPVGIVLAEPDVILTLGALVAGELYGRWCPVVVVSRADYPSLASGLEVRIDAPRDPGGRCHVLVGGSLFRT